MPWARVAATTRTIPPPTLIPERASETTATPPSETTLPSAPAQVSPSPRNTVAMARLTNGAAAITRLAVPAGTLRSASLSSAASRTLCWTLTFWAGALTTPTAARPGSA